jgi:RND superfamily putative drug exporter
VFLLSRIKEEYLRTGDNERSVEIGLGQTGRLITAAAVLISVVFLAFATSSITFIKLFGLGLALAVIMDATLVRGVLVPAFMKLAGGANWWAPAWMQRIAARSGLGEVDVPATGPATGPDAGDSGEGRGAPASPLDLRRGPGTRDDGGDHDREAGPDRVPARTGGT